MANKAIIDQNIINVAKSLFINNGFISTTISDISKASGYSRRTIYQHFDSKEVIMNHIVYQELLRLDMKIKELKENDLNDKYYLLCELIVDYINENPLSYAAVSKTKVYKINNNDTILQDILLIGDSINKNICDILVHYHDTNIATCYLLFQYLSGVCNLLNNNEAFILKDSAMDKKQFLAYSYQLFLKGLSNV